MDTISPMLITVSCCAAARPRKAKPTLKKNLSKSQLLNVLILFSTEHTQFVISRNFSSCAKF